MSRNRPSSPISVRLSLSNFRNDGPSSNNATSPPSGTNAMHWDFRSSPEDMEEMWNRPEVAREWHKSGEKKGQVRFLKDKKRSYPSRVQLKAVVDSILSKYFSTEGTKPVDLTAYVEKHEFFFDAVFNEEVSNDENREYFLKHYFHYKGKSCISGLIFTSRILSVDIWLLMESFHRHAISWPY